MSAESFSPSSRGVPRVWASHPIAAAVVMAVVLGTVLATYWPALSAGARFMDDKFYIGAPWMQHPSWASIKTIFAEVFSPSTVNGYYQPLSLLSVMLDFLDRSAADSLLPFHRTTLLLHLMNVALVVALLYVMFGNWVAAGLMGLLYGAHPLNADAVLWVAERKTVLSTGFALWSLLLYLMYVRHADRTARHDWKRYSASVLMYACALLSKPTAIPLVVLLLVLDYWPLKRFNRVAVLEKIPYLVVGALAAVVAVVSQARAGQEGAAQVMNPLYVPVVVGYGVVLYLCKTVVPTGLVYAYPNPDPFRLSNPEVLLGFLAAVVLGAALVLSARRTRAWLAGAMFFVIAIFPTVGVIRFTSSIAANRFVYLPMVGLLLPLAWGLVRLWDRDVGGLKRWAVRVILATVGAILVMGSIVTTRRYEAHWRDTLTLLEYFLAKSPNDSKLYVRLGNEWIQRGNQQSAIIAFRKAAQLDPKWAENHLNLGRALFTVGEYAQAEQAFANAVRETPHDWRAHMLMGMTLSRQEHFEEALTEFQTAARIAPRQPQAHYEVAATLARLGRSDGAADACRETLRLDPTNLAARRMLEAIAPRTAASP